MFGFLSEQPNANSHFLNRLIKLLNHFISIEPEDKPKGFECHHIVPKSWKPEWSKEPYNLLKLSAKAHYVIHHLMWKSFPDSISMQRSFWFTCHGQQKQKITAKIYENLKKDLSHSENTKQKMSVSHKNISIETRQKMSVSQKNRAPFSKEHRQKLSEKRKRRVLSEETRKKIGEKSKGRNIGRIPHNKRKTYIRRSKTKND